jgi:selenide,water dikinase
MSQINEQSLPLLYDPQTSGGLLLSVESSQSHSLLGKIRKLFPRAEIIGKVTPRSVALLEVHG